MIMDTIAILDAANSILLVPIYFILRNVNTTLKDLHKTTMEHAQEIGFLKGRIQK